MLIRHFINASLFNFYKLNRMEYVRPSSDLASFRNIFNNSKKIVVLTGAGVSAESGIPTFRGAGGLWREYDAKNLATPEAFRENPMLVWQFYNFRRQIAFSKFPNDAHKAIAECQSRLAREGRNLTVITQNVDGLHQKAGTNGVIELHGSLSKTKCLKCNDVAILRNPTCTDSEESESEEELPPENILERALPKCKKDGCGGLLRPFIVWFGENLDEDVLNAANSALAECDLCLVVGTSSTVYPASTFAPQVAARGVPVAEFNIHYGQDSEFDFYFVGPCTKTIPPALAP